MRALVGLGLLLPLSVFSQGFIDIARIDYTGGLMGNDYDRLGGLNATVQVPILLSSGDAILTGFVLEGRGIEDAFSDYKARNITLNLGANINIKENQPLTVLTFQRMNSDGFTFERDAYQFGMAALYTYKKTETTELRVGFYANAEFMGPIITPLLGVDWKISPNVRFYGVLPATGAISIRQNDKWYVGLDFLGVFQTYQQPADGDFYLQRAVNLLSLFSEHYLTKNVVFSAKLGYLLGSGYRLFAKGDKIDWALNLVKFGDDRTELDRIITDGLVFKAGLAFRFDLENN